MPHFSNINIGRDGRNYATMMMPEASKGYTHYAMVWWTSRSDIEQTGRDDMEDLCAKVGGEIRDFPASEVKEVAERRKGFDGLVPVGAQCAKNLCVLVFNL